MVTMPKPPETVHLVLEFDSGLIGIMAFITVEYDVHNEIRWTHLATKEEVEKEINKSVFPAEMGKVVRWKFIEPSDIPEDRTYRNALRHGPRKGFHYDIEHARGIHRALLRQARMPHLQQLDFDYQRADEAGDHELKEKIAAKKRELRDVPRLPDIDEAKTVEELKLIWPVEFGEIEQVTMASKPPVLPTSLESGLPLMRDMSESEKKKRLQRDERLREEDALRRGAVRPRAGG